ncbi:hypothetical protein NDU88_004458, partial [Pleurodeles waltl]
AARRTLQRTLHAALLQRSPEMRWFVLWMDEPVPAAPLPSSLSLPPAAAAPGVKGRAEQGHRKSGRKANLSNLF